MSGLDSNQAHLHYDCHFAAPLVGVKWGLIVDHTDNYIASWNCIYCRRAATLVVCIMCSSIAFRLHIS